MRYDKSLDLVQCTCVNPSLPSWAPLQSLVIVLAECNVTGLCQKCACTPLFFNVIRTIALDHSIRLLLNGVIYVRGLSSTEVTLGVRGLTAYAQVRHGVCILGLALSDF